MLSFDFPRFETEEQAESHYAPLASFITIGANIPDDGSQLRAGSISASFGNFTKTTGRDLKGLRLLDVADLACEFIVYLAKKKKPIEVLPDERHRIETYVACKVWSAKVQRADVLDPILFKQSALSGMLRDLSGTAYRASQRAFNVLQSRLEGFLQTVIEAKGIEAIVESPEGVYEQIKIFADLLISDAIDSARREVPKAYLSCVFESSKNYLSLDSAMLQKEQIEAETRLGKLLEGSEG